jgi:predicted nucleic acid-binding protein
MIDNAQFRHECSCLRCCPHRARQQVLRSAHPVIGECSRRISILLLQSLAEFSNVAIRKARIPANAVKTTIEAWLAVLPVQSADDSDLVLALEAVHAHRLPFWDAMLWASAQRAGVRHMLSGDFQDGFELQESHLSTRSILKIIN